LQKRYIPPLAADGRTQMAEGKETAPSVSLFCCSRKDLELYLHGSGTGIDHVVAKFIVDGICRVAAGVGRSTAGETPDGSAQPKLDILAWRIGHAGAEVP